MYSHRLKLKLRGLGVTQEEAAEVMEMSKRGFQLAMVKESFTYANMIKLAEKYQIILDELYLEENNMVNEQDEKYCVKKEKTNKFCAPTNITNQTIKQYEERISDLKEQLEYLKKLLDNDIREGAKSA